jgi:hypothetical protein
MDAPVGGETVLSKAAIAALQTTFDKLGDYLSSL